MACEGVDAFVQSAGLVKAKRPEDFVSANVDGTRNLLVFALDRRCDIRSFVFVSSLAAHGPSDDEGLEARLVQLAGDFQRAAGNQLAANGMVAGAVDAGPAFLALARQEASEQAADHRARTGRMQPAVDRIKRGRGADRVVGKRTSLRPGWRPAVA